MKSCFKGFSGFEDFSLLYSSLSFFYFTTFKWEILNCLLHQIWQLRLLVIFQFIYFWNTIDSTSQQSIKYFKLGPQLPVPVDLWISKFGDFHFISLWWTKGLGFQIVVLKVLPLKHLETHQVIWKVHSNKAKTFSLS